MANRLIYEKSPYLLQHGENPVDWYPWGEEAFAKARKEGKPVFLSIGYSTCHWCHVMERESFENQEAAELLNRYYVAVKVDREERPDIDAVYMEVCQIMNGSGGWPLTILMDGEQKPFFAGTYFPLHTNARQIGLIELLEAFSGKWREGREELMSFSMQITERLAQQERQQGSRGKIQKELPDKAVEAFAGSFDRQNGGFGRAPKFPMPHNLLFLLEYGQIFKDDIAVKMAETTLIQMYRGGIFDHIGGGFSRYSTDDRWLVPHFEKMLYDNALLLCVYAKAFMLTKRMLYQRVFARVFAYLKQELHLAEGGYACGQDADSEGEEGLYYLFEKEEIDRIFGEKKAALFCSWYGVTQKGNFEGRNILNLLLNASFRDKNEEIAGMCRELYAYRKARRKLHLDDKALTSWNSMLTAGLCLGYMAFGEQEYLQEAEKIQEFIEKYLTDGKGRLFIRYRDGERIHPGQLEDYAYYAWALLLLYQCNQKAELLGRALKVSEELLELFSDPEKEGFYLYAADAEQLIVRPKEVYDGAVPSGNSAAALVLQHLAELTGEEKWQRESERQLRFLGAWAEAYPSACSFAMLAFLRYFYPPVRIVYTAGELPSPSRLAAIWQQYGNQNKSVLLLSKVKGNQEFMNKLLPELAAYPIPETGELYYVCENGVCKAPVSEPDQLL